MVTVRGGYLFIIALTSGLSCTNPVQNDLNKKQPPKGGWKLIISDMHEVEISATRMTDVIIQTAIEAHSESELTLQTAFVCLGQNLLSGYCQMSS